jgi:hypothetical protein
MGPLHGILNSFAFVEFARIFGFLIDFLLNLPWDSLHCVVYILQQGDEKFGNFFTGYLQLLFSMSICRIVRG